LLSLFSGLGEQGSGSCQVRSSDSPSDLAMARMVIIPADVYHTSSVSIVMCLYIIY
jgi:hypothetical protein